MPDSRNGRTASAPGGRRNQTGGPELSVIVNAFRRETFIRNALESLQHQTLPTGRFEVLVTSDVDPSTLGPQTEGLELEWLGSGTDSYGRDTTRAIRAARGDVVLLLDDDDLFLPAKLEVVASAFREDPNLGYFHNNFGIVDDQGVRRDAHPFRRSMRRAREAAGFLRISAADSWTVLRRYPPLAPAFNNSSLAVRREMVLRWLPTLEAIPLTVEPFFLLASVLAGKALALDPRILTLYRVHGANVTGIGSGSEALRRVRGFTARALPGYEAVARMARESGNAEAAREMEALVRIHRVYAAFRDSRLSRWTMWDAWRRARELQDTYTWSDERGVDAAALVYLAWPRVAQRWYARRLVGRA